MPARRLAVEGEHSHDPLRALPECFPRAPVVVATLADGAPPAYLPNADACGKGIYQELIAVLAPGSLEQLIDAVREQIRAWFRTG